jgi:hypothetical protein
VEVKEMQGMKPVEVKEKPESELVEIRNVL